MINFDVYPENAAESLGSWDRGEIVHTVEMGGIGPGYEQAIQEAVFEAIRVGLATPFPSAEDKAGWKRWNAEADAAMAKMRLGLSGAQAVAAKSLAAQFLQWGPRKAVKNLVDAGGEDRLILASKGWRGHD